MGLNPDSVAFFLCDLELDIFPLTPEFVIHNWEQYHPRL